MTPAQGGTEVVKGWYHALIVWAFVAAVAAVVVFAVMWALGNVRSTPQTASRGKWGVIVAVVACMLLGGSQVYLQTLYEKWAPGFQPDPASYAVADAPLTGRFEVIDRSDEWNAVITKYRSLDGWDEPLLTDPTLVAMATDCAKALSGAPGTRCDPESPMWKAEYSSAQLRMLDGPPTRDQARQLVSQPTRPDMLVRRAAWVAVKDSETKHAKMVSLWADGPCDGDGCPQIVVWVRVSTGSDGVPWEDPIGGG